MHTKYWWVWLLAALLLGGLLLYQRSSKPTSTETVKIGSLLPFTGPLGDFGEEINRGALLAIDDLKAQGITVSYDAQDDAFDPKQGVSAGKKLLETGNVSAAFTAVWEEAKPVVPLFNQAGVPLVVAWDSNKDIEKAGPSIFSIGFSTEKDGALMADYAYDTLGLRNVAILEAVDPAVKLMTDAFAAEFTTKGGVVQVREQVQPDATDFRTTIPKITKGNPQGIYFAVIPPQHSAFLSQVRRTNYKGALLTIDSFIQSERDAAGAAAEGVYYSYIYADDPQGLSAKYKNRFNKDPSDAVLVSFGYDSMLLLAHAVSDANQKHISVHDALLHTSIKGYGTAVSMNGSQISERVEKIYHIENGKSVIVH